MWRKGALCDIFNCVSETKKKDQYYKNQSQSFLIIIKETYAYFY